MKQPLVSIIIPAYNVAPYVGQAIDSALAQTYKNIEIIVVDDGSKDGTRSVLEPYIAKKLITYIYQNNKGLAAARNTGIKNSHGEFIALLDSDDLFLPEKIEKQVGYLVADTPGILLNLKETYYSGEYVFRGLLRRNFIIPLSVVFRKSEIDRVGLFNENFRRAEDWEYWLRLSYNGTQFCHLSEILAKCRLHAGSWSQGVDGWKTKVKERKAVVAIFRDLYERMNPVDRWHYHIRIILLKEKLKLWYVVIGSRFSPFKWVFDRLEKKRWKIDASS
jgi:glycosyltransferase involved in cell wall biosynthesis